jgi:hypothetical protein
MFKNNQKTIAVNFCNVAATLQMYYSIEFLLYLYIHKKEYGLVRRGKIILFEETKQFLNVFFRKESK